MTISIIIPVLNEAESINSLISHLYALDPSDKVEIIVVDGAADSGTVKAIEDKKVITAVSEPGRSVQMNRGASLAHGDVLLFLHADTLLPPDAFGLIRNALADARFIGGAFDLGIRSERKIFRITERYVALRTRLTRVPFGDQALFLRRDYFKKIGGYRSIPVMEDVELMARIRKRGDSVCIIPEKVMTSARRWEKEGVLRTTMRNWMLQLLYVLGVPTERLARFYR